MNSIGFAGKAQAREYLPQQQLIAELLSREADFTDKEFFREVQPWNESIRGKIDWSLCAAQVLLWARTLNPKTVDLTKIADCASMETNTVYAKQSGLRRLATALGQGVTCELAVRVQLIKLNLIC